MCVSTPNFMPITNDATRTRHDAVCVAADREGIQQDTACVQADVCGTQQHVAIVEAERCQMTAIYVAIRYY